MGRFFALVGLVFLMAAGVSFATSPEYVVQSVTVEGSKVLSLDQANAIAGVQGANIFTVDAQRCRPGWPRRRPLLKGVKVETRLPNNVIIDVQERKPATVWVIGDGTPLLASDDHVVVGTPRLCRGLRDDIRPRADDRYSGDRQASACT